MKLMTKEVLKKMPALYSGEDVPLAEKPVAVKFFNPCGAATWYAFEGEPVLDDDGNEVDYLFFGWVTLGMGPECDEAGYFHLNELKDLKLPFGLHVERDMHMDPGKVLFGDTRDGKRYREAA